MAVVDDMVCGLVISVLSKKKLSRIPRYQGSGKRSDVSTYMEEVARQSKGKAAVQRPSCGNRAANCTCCEAISSSEAKMKQLRRDGRKKKGYSDKTSKKMENKLKTLTNRIKSMGITGYTGQSLAPAN